MSNEIENLKKVVFDFEALDFCPLCGSKAMIHSGRIRWLDIDMWYVACPNCSLKFMNPRPTMESYKDFYKNFFWQQKIRNIGFHQEGQMWQGKKYKWDNEELWDPKEGKKNRMDKQREQKTKIIISDLKENITIAKDSKILEVGCSFGATLDELHEKYGCKVYGIEPSTEAKEEIEKLKEIEILGDYAEDLEAISKKDLKFDIIIFSHVLENTTDPVRVVKFAKECLANKGVIYIQTPNLLVYDQMNPYHPYIFSRYSLNFLADKLGLDYKPISELINKMLTVLLINK